MTTPVMPGSRTSSGSTTMSQIEVPITITNVARLARRRRPGPTRTSRRCRPRPRPIRAARAARPRSGRRASPHACPAARTSSPSFSAGCVETGVGGLEVLGRRQALVRRPHRLVAGGAALAAARAGQPPDDPVGRLDEARRRRRRPRGPRATARSASGSTTPRRCARRSARGTRSPRSSATSFSRSATGWAAWCFHSFGHACRRSRQRGVRAQRHALARRPAAPCRR